MTGGVSAIRRVTEFDVSQFNTKIAAQVRDFNPMALGLSREETVRMDRYVQFAMVAARMALEDSNMLDLLVKIFFRLYICLIPLLVNRCHHQTWHNKDQQKGNRQLA